MGNDSPTATALAHIFEDALGVTDVVSTDTFVELGGSSLQVVEVLAAIQQRLSVRPSIGDFVAHPSIAQLADRIDQLAAKRFGDAGSIATALREASGAADEPALFCIAGSGGSVWSFVSLAASVPPSLPVYAFQQKGLEFRALPDWTMRQLVHRVTSMIREIQPHGPYRLLGHSMGGVAALEVARRLEYEGESVDVVVLLDATVPTRSRKSTSMGGSQNGRVDRSWAYRIRLYGDLLCAGLIRRPLGRQQEVFYELGLRVQNNHKLTPWSGRVLMIGTADTIHDRSFWNDILLGDVTSIETSGDHMSVIRDEETVRVIGDAITAQLRRRTDIDDHEI
ncbi:MAG: alpha/beta fold hydrolase [Rhodococcus sp. (in: high G+C Gram-positive bacteria)]|uniref:thioesterase domain-containing protein n=1 Tax=Rhodococcus sp. TaxID=1831 RepID=UPI002ADAA417|nr:alpha/beta fold hydrolase [Rhodococcus sp. (in: high G+C Gram-positive bacteria)]